MEKWIWYFFGSILLLITIASFMTAMSLSCGMMYNDYGFYYYCRNYRNRQMFQALISFGGSMMCFGMGGKKE